MGYCVVVIDLDGTLLNKQKTVSDRNIKALKRLHDIGVAVVLCSGRAAPSIDHVQKMIDIPLDYICYNGACVLTRAKHSHPTPSLSVFSSPVETHLVETLIEFVQSHGLAMNVYLDRQMYVVASTPEHMEYTYRYQRLTSTVYTYIQSYNQLPSLQSYKLLIFTPQVEQTYQLVLQCLKDRSLEAHVVRETFFVEVLQPGTHKGRALQELCKYYGVDVGCTMALGDGENDKEVLQVAGLGVAMANAQDITKAMAKKVSLLNHEEDAVGLEIEHLLEKGEFEPLRRFGKLLLDADLWTESKEILDELRGLHVAKVDDSFCLEDRMESVVYVGGRDSRLLEKCGLVIVSKDDGIEECCDIVSDWRREMLLEKEVIPLKHRFAKSQKELVP